MDTPDKEEEKHILPPVLEKTKNMKRIDENRRETGHKGEGGGKVHPPYTIE